MPNAALLAFYGHVLQNRGQSMLRLPIVFAETAFDNDHISLLLRNREMQARSSFLTSAPARERIVMRPGTRCRFATLRTRTVAAVRERTYATLLHKESYSHLSRPNDRGKVNSGVTTQSYFSVRAD